MKQVRLELNSQLEPRVGTLFAMLERTRAYLHRLLEDVTDEMVDFTPNDKSIESIGSLLWHIAGVEWGWIFGDIDGKPFDLERFKYAFVFHPKAPGHQPKGNSLQFYLDLLAEVRSEIFERLQQMRDDDLSKTIIDEGKEYSYEWILFHIIEHEALHVGQVSLLKRLYKTEKQKKLDLT